MSYARGGIFLALQKMFFDMSYALLWFGLVWFLGWIVMKLGSL
jgi:hypothetical protein